MNPESKDVPMITRNNSMPSKLNRTEQSLHRNRNCQSQLQQMPFMNSNWKVKNNHLRTHSGIMNKTQYKRSKISKKLCQTLDESQSDQMTKTMIKKLKTQASEIDKTPKLVTGMFKLRQMHLLMVKDLKKVTYYNRPKKQVFTEYHTRKTNPGYGRSLCGRYYTS